MGRDQFAMLTNSNFKNTAEFREGSFIRDGDGHPVMTKRFIFQGKIIHSVYTNNERVKLCEARADWTDASAHAVGNFSTLYQ